MKTNRSMLFKIVGSLVTLFAVAIIIGGCSGDYSSPTVSSQSAYEQFWNPGPGDQIDGHEVPLAGPNYWEDADGNYVNPWLAQPLGTVIGVLGGVVNCGRHQLIIPPGAVDHNVTIMMTFASQTGVAVDCNPSPFQFLLPVTLNLSYDGTQYDPDVNRNADPSLLAIFYMPPNYDGDPAGLERMPTSMNGRSQVLTTQTDHFSRYIIG